MFQILNTLKGSRSLLPDDSSSNSSQSELLKQQEDSYRKEIEREKMEKAKYQREIEEMRQKLSKLPTAPSPLEVNKIYNKIKIVRL